MEKTYTYKSGNRPLAWSADETHQSLAGSFLTAGVIYATIFRDNPVYSSANGGLAANTANLLKQIAWDTFADSLANINLQSITPDLLWQNNQLIAGNYQQYFWYKDMQWLTAANSNTLNVNQSGHYFLITENTNGCKLKSVTQHLIITNTDEFDNDNIINVYPNPANDFVNLNCNISDYSTCNISIYNLQGSLIKTEKLKDYHHQINVSDLSNGVYYLQITFEEFSKTIKIVIRK